MALGEAAAEYDFPLFEVPYEPPFIAITEKAFSHLVNEQYAVLRRALAAHERLERIVLSERGLDGVASGLGALIGGPALIFDARGELLARRAGRAGLPPEVIAALSAELRERVRAGARRGYVPVPTTSRRVRSRCRWRAARRPAAATLRRPRRGCWRPRTPGR